MKIFCKTTITFNDDNTYLTNITTFRNHHNFSYYLQTLKGVSFNYSSNRHDRDKFSLYRIDFCDWYKSHYAQRTHLARIIPSFEISMKAFLLGYQYYCVSVINCLDEIV